MLIKCEYCDFFTDGKGEYKHPVTKSVNYGYCKMGMRECDYFHECAESLINPEYAYRYRLAEQLQCAVLDRLLDPKNVKKGKFVADAKYNWDKLIEELYELRDELCTRLIEYHDADFAREKIGPQRVLEECGDVAAYLAALIEAVKNGVE